MRSILCLACSYLQSSFGRFDICDSPFTMRTAFLRCPSLLQTSIAVLTFLDVYFTLLDMQLVRGSSLTGFIPLIAAHGATQLLSWYWPTSTLTTSGSDGSRFHCAAPSAPWGDRSHHAQRARFGRQLATRQDIDVLGPVGVAARTAATVADAFAILDTIWALTVPASPSVSPAIPTLGCAAWSTTSSSTRRHRKPRPSSSPSVSRCESCIRSWAPPITSLRVHLPHPALGTKTDYRRYFGCPCCCSTSWSPGSRCAPPTCNGR